MKRKWISSFEGETILLHNTVIKPGTRYLFSVNCRLFDSNDQEIFDGTFIASVEWFVAYIDQDEFDGRICVYHKDYRQYLYIRISAILDVEVEG